MSRAQKIALAIGFAIVVVGIGYALYLVFFRPLTTTTVQPPATIDEIVDGTLPQAGEGQPQTGLGGDNQLPDNLAPSDTTPQNEQLTQDGEFISEIATGGIARTDIITENPGLEPILSSNGRDINFYDQKEGFFYRVDKNGKLVKLSDQKFFNVEEITWAPNTNKTILKYPDGSQIYFDFETQKQVTLPSHWEDFSFAPNSDQIAFKNITDSTDDNWLAISKPDGSQPKVVVPLGNNGSKVQAAWSPNDQIIGTYTESIGLNQQEVYFLGKNDENFKLTVADGRDFRPLWFPTGEKLVYSVYNSRDGYKPSLWIVDAIGDRIGENRVKLPVNTWADRCSFNTTGSALYCARPKEMPAMAGLFPNLIEEENIKSEIIKINTQTGKVTTVGQPDIAADITNIVVTEKEDIIYFQDSTDNLLKRIRLK